jgi:hypothetical protein
MEKKLFIGINFSKKTLDVSVMARENPKEVNYRPFTNNREGCLELLSWVKGQSRCTKEEWLFCGDIPACTVCC